MKKILSILLLAVLMASCSGNKIKEDEVPGAAVAAFKAKYPAATDTKWKTEKKDGKTIYEAMFKNNGKEVEAEFAEDGTFLLEEE